MVGQCSPFHINRTISIVTALNKRRVIFFSVASIVIDKQSRQKNLRNLIIAIKQGAPCIHLAKEVLHLLYNTFLSKYFVLNSSSNTVFFNSPTYMQHPLAHNMGKVHHNVIIVRVIINIQDFSCTCIMR